MKITTSEISFSEIVRNEDGSAASETSIKEILVIEWDGEQRKFKARDSEGHSEQCGRGSSRSDAVLDYLRVRMGMEIKPVKVIYSQRVY